MEKRVGLIGFGAICQTIVGGWQASPVNGHTLAALIAREHQLAAARARIGAGTEVTASLDDFLAGDLDVAVECAGHQAVAELGPRILRSGVDLMVLSVGCFVRDDVFNELRTAASVGGARILVPVGAI